MRVVIALNEEGELVFAGLNVDKEAEKENRRDAAKLVKQGFDVKTIEADTLNDYTWQMAKDAD